MNKNELFPKKIFNYWKKIADDKFIIMNGRNAFSINSSGLEIWKGLNGFCSVDMLADRMKNRYPAVPAATIEGDLCETLVSWQDNDCIILDYDPLFKLGKKNANLDFSLDGVFECNNDGRDLDVLFIIPPPSTIETNFNNNAYNSSTLGVGYLFSIIDGSQERSLGILNLWNSLVEERDLLKCLSGINPKIVAFSCMTENYANGIRIARLVKDKISAQAFTVFGGPHVTFEYRAALRSGVVDLCFIGEAFTSFPRFIYDYFAHGDWRGVDGIAYVADGKLIKTAAYALAGDLDALPFPAHVGHDLRRLHSAPIVSSFGCPFSCKFCAAGALSGNSYRLRSVASVLEEIVYLKNRFAVSHFVFVDDTISYYPERVTALCAGIKKRKLDITWSVESRVDVAAKNYEILERMREAGCISIQFGIESGDDGKLKEIRKGITRSTIERGLANAQKAGISIRGSLIVGIPGESSASIRSTLDFSIALQGAYDGLFVVSWFVPYPGTYYHENISRFDSQILNIDNFDLFNTTIPQIIPPDADADEMMNYFFEKSFERWKSRPKELSGKSIMDLDFLKRKNSYDYGQGSFKTRE
jgi:anaerobic magnesium-protoporphyrin IX monomethyl ester cyclase